jgi:hypothetical protein
MSATHRPMHAEGCPTCDRRRARIVGYATQMAFRDSPAGKKAIAKSELQRIRREQEYRDAPASDGRAHHHRQGRRHRIAANRRRGPVKAMRKLRQFRKGRAEAA